MRPARGTLGHIPSPLRTFHTVLAIVFVAEGVVMLLLPLLLGGGDKDVEPVLDAALLIALPQVSERLGASALLAQPLLYRDRILGVIALSNQGTERTFTERDLEILHLLAVQAAIAIENARLYEHVQSLATIQERERLAREMHDGLAQTLAFLSPD